MRFTAGDRVVVRGERWVVEEAAAFADATLLTLASAEPRAPARRCRLLAPFDRPVTVRVSPAIRGVTKQRWAHLLREFVSGQRIHGQLLAAGRAAIDILPFQLEPALALVQGRASRFLLADEVGLGKTIQAGLMLAELRQRSWCDRALVITPPGLRQQWADDLRQRFDIPSFVVDAATLAAHASSLPHGVNPWAVEPVVITSIDFIKQPEVLRGVAAELWDLVIVDEAHQVGVASLRYEAVRSVAARARHLVLVTATPHAGDPRAYGALCALGQLDQAEPILLFRRTRGQAGLPRTRRAHLLAVRQTAEALDMHGQLDAYLAQLWKASRTAGRHDAQLVAMVLAKRAFSSAHSLLRSLERRLAGLEQPADTPAQPALPFECDIDESDDPVLPLAPAFDRVDDERAVLRRLVRAAQRAAKDERKLHAVRRLVRRIREPLIVFTEYRDTLDAIAAAVGASRRVALLHGGQTHHERRASIAAFTTGGADLLLATDAGSEGLNLQPRCRAIVNLELPWSPVRLEQRIGRVDRIGQARTVHAINLLAAGTAEGDVLEGLLRRLDRIRMSEIELAACVIGRSEPAPRASVEPAHARTIDLRDTAGAEAFRLAGARAVRIGREPLREGLVPVTAIRFGPHASPADARRRRVIAFMRIRLVTDAGRLIEDRLVPLSLAIDVPPGRTRRGVRAAAESLVGSALPALVHAAQQQARARADAIVQRSADWTARAAEREHRIARHADLRETPVQPGLFDSRALKTASDRRHQVETTRLESHARLNRLEADSHVLVPHEPEIALLLFTC